MINGTTIESGSMVSLLDKSELTESVRMSIARPAVVLQTSSLPFQKFEEDGMRRLVMIAKNKLNHRTGEEQAQKCLNQLVAQSQGMARVVLLGNAMLDIGIRVFLVVQVIEMDSLFIEKWSFLLLQLLIRTLLILSLCCVALGLFRDNPVSLWLNRHRTFEGWRSLALLLPPELYWLLPGRKRVSVFLVVHSIYRGIEVSILFAAMVGLAIEYMMMNVIHAESVLLMTGLLTEQLIRYILLLAYMGCVHEQGRL